MTLRERLSRLRARLSETGAEAAGKRPAGSRAKRRKSAERRHDAAARSETGEGGRDVAARRDSSARRSKRRQERAPKRSRAGGARQASDLIASVVLELGKLARDIVAIPAGLYMALAELAGSVVLVVWRRVLWPLALAAAAALAALYRLALRQVTPARAVFAVGLAAAIALGASQWLDYRGISIGTEAYSGEVGLVAPAPEIERVRAGDAHGWVMVPLAAVSLAALIAAVAVRPRIAHLLIPVGVAAIVIAIAVDAPKGLDEGAAAVAYQGAVAHLLEGFWLQIAGAAALIACGFMLPAYLRATPAPAPEWRGPGPLVALALRAGERALQAGRRGEAAARRRVHRPPARRPRGSARGAAP